MLKNHPVYLPYNKRAKPNQLNEKSINEYLVLKNQESEISYSIIIKSNCK